MWIELTEAKLKTRLTGAELTKLKSVALASGLDGDELLAEIFTGVTREVRGKVAACNRNQLGSGATIPDELEHHALAMVVYRFITRLPIAGNNLLLDQRKEAYNDALTALNSAAKCEIRIEQPSDVSSEATAGGAAKVISKRAKQVTGSSLSSL